jgi:general secretion pathway protein F
MPVFAYHAFDASGRTHAGVIDADSLRAAWQRLRARGMYPTDVRGDARPAVGGRVRPHELAAATRQLAALVGVGVPASDALDAVAGQAPPPLARALTLARARVHEGRPLAEALGESPRLFSPLYCNLVRAGEASGTLATILARLARHTETAARTRARIVQALTYPAIVVGASLLVVAFVAASVVPQVARLFAETGTPLPLATRLLVAATDLGARTWWLWALVMLLSAAGLRRWSASARGRVPCDRLLLALPVVGSLAATAAAARLARTLATLLASGIPLEAALGLAATATGNAGVGAATVAAREAVRRGEPLAQALGESGLLPPLFLHMVATGERGGTLAAALEQAADAHDAETERALATALALLEPVLVVAMGAVVLGLVLAVLLPLLDFDPGALR